MTRFCKQVFYHLLVAGMLLPAAFAASKESPHDMLAKSFQQANLWNQGPVKLTAKVRLPKGDGTDINLEYALSWVGPDEVARGVDGKRLRSGDRSEQWQDVVCEQSTKTAGPTDTA